MRSGCKLNGKAILILIVLLVLIWLVKFYHYDVYTNRNVVQEKVSYFVLNVQDKIEEVSNEFNILKNRIYGMKEEQNKIYHKDKICESNYELIVLVLCKQSLTLRNLLRHTWGKNKQIFTTDGLKDLNWKFIYVLEAPIKLKQVEQVNTEILAHEDVIIVNKSRDTVNKDSYKLMITLQYISTKCKYKYVLVIMDNMVVNTPSMYSFLHDTKTPQMELYGGLIRHQSPILPNSGLFISKSYPRHAHGQTFIMSHDLVSNIIPFFNWENYFEFSEYVGQLVLKGGVDVWPIFNFLYYDKGMCNEPFYNGLIIRFAEQTDIISCVKVLYEKFQKILPEV